ncbi:MAG: hypothetical protein EXX96DRAFT_456251, partial [Benjaminiella poitrasii]
DCKANSIEHLNAYYKIAYFFEVHHDKPFNCFSLRKIFISSYMTIDTYIINTQILKS